MLVLTVRSRTPDYRGYRVSFASGTASGAYACSGGGSIPFSRGCFKINAGFFELRPAVAPFHLAQLRQAGRHGNWVS